MGDPEAPLWADLEKIGDEMLWDWLDARHLSRALVRSTAAATWLAVAVAVGARYWWAGIPMLAGCLLSIVHARRRAVLSAADRMRTLGPVVRWFLPYPRSPRPHPIGILDALGVVIGMLATGWVLGSFRGAASNGQAMAIAAAGVVAAIGDLNVTGHVSWEFGRPSRGRILARLAVSVIATALVALTLFPPADIGADRKVAVVVFVLVTVGTLLTGIQGVVVTGRQRRSIDRHIRSLKRAIRYADSRHIHQLKNVARPIYAQVQEVNDRSLRHRIRRLTTAISSMERLFAVNAALGSNAVGEVLAGLRGLDDAFLDYVVTADLEPADLPEGDQEMIAVAVGDLAANAFKARASRFTIGLTAQRTDNGSLLEIRATCQCPRAFPHRVPPGSSLAGLANMVVGSRGSFVVDGAGSTTHTFVLRWPSIATPRPRVTAANSASMSGGAR
jgi:hypothetical protein